MSKRPAGSKSAAEMAKEVKKFRDESADRSRQRLPETYLTELLKELQTHEMARQDSRAEPVSAKARTKGADWNGICYPAHVWAVSMQKVVKLVKQKSVNGIWRPHEAAWKQSGQREAYIIGYKGGFDPGALERRRRPVIGTLLTTMRAFTINPDPQSLFSR